MRAFLMNSTTWTRPNYGPADRGGGSDDSDNQDDNNEGEDHESDDEEDSDSEADDEISGDAADAFEALFKRDEGDADGDADSDQDEEDQEAVQSALATEMADAVKKFAIPEDMIPEDFNPADPKQLRTVLASVQQQAMRATMQIMFKPIQVTLERMSRDTNRLIDSKINGNASDSRVRDLILEEIPAAASPGRYEVIRGMYDRAFKKHKKPAAAIAATKKAMKALGVSLGDANRGGRRSDRDEAVLTGNDALDAFARLPVRKPAKSSQNRVANRLSR